MQRDRLPLLIIAAALLAALLASAALIAPSGARTADPSADRSISVDATGTADAAPDQAVIRVAATAGGADTSVETGEVSVSYQVRVTYNATRA